MRNDRKTAKVDVPENQKKLLMIKKVNDIVGMLKEINIDVEQCKRINIVL